jgi:hypothetical protein
MSNAEPVVATMPASSHSSKAARTPPVDAIANPMSVSRLGVSPARASRLDEAGGAQAAQVPRDERLREVDVPHEVRDGPFTLGEALDEPQACGIGQGLVDDGDLNEVGGRRRQGRDRRADARWAWHGAGRTPP